MQLKQITAAQDAPVTLAEARAHLRVDSTAEDTLITSMITSATEVAEQLTGRAIMPQTWELTLDSFDDGIVLTRPPVRSITSITYVDTAGATQTLSASLYRLRADDFGAATVTPVYGQSWPETLDDTDTVTVRFVCGYASEDSVPQPIKSWILLQVGSMFENRESESASGTSKLIFADGLLDRYKVFA